MAKQSHNLRIWRIPALPLCGASSSYLKYASGRSSVAPCTALKCVGCESKTSPQRNTPSEHLRFGNRVPKTCRAVMRRFHPGLHYFGKILQSRQFFARHHSHESTSPVKSGMTWAETLFSAGFMLILLLLPLHAFLSTWLGTAIGPLLVWKSWKEILLVALVPFVIWYVARQPGVVKLLWSRPVNRVILLYVLLHVGLALFSQSSTGAIIAGLMMNLRFLAMFVLAQLIAAGSRPWTERLKNWIPTWLLWTTIGLAVFALLQVTVLPKDFLGHFGYNKDTTIAPITVLDSDPSAPRAQATMRGPNTLGEFLLIPLAFGLEFALKKKRASLAATALGLGVITLALTGSRSAWIGFVFVAASVVLSHFPPGQLKKWARWAAVPAILAIGAFLLAAVSVPALRLAVFHSSVGRATLVTGSTEGHWQATVNGVQDIIAHPFGTGPGSAGPASFYNQKGQPNISENYFVQIGQEVGLIGLALLVIICYLTARYLNKAGPTARLLLASFIGLSIVNLFLHGWADDPTSMIWWGLAGLYFFQPSSQRAF